MLNAFDRQQFEEISGWETDAMDNFLDAMFGLGVQHSAVELPEAMVYDIGSFMQHIYFPNPDDAAKFYSRAQRHADISKAMRTASARAPVRTGSEGRENALITPRPYKYQQSS
jgi:hypothetical protein